MLILEHFTASGESDGECQDSIEQQVSEDAINDIPDNSDKIQDLERELQHLKTERRKVELRRKIEEEKEDLKKLQHPPTANSLAIEGTSKGEKIMTLQHVARKSRENLYKS